MLAETKHLLPAAGLAVPAKAKSSAIGRSRCKPNDNQDQDRLHQLLTGIDPSEQQRKIEQLQKQLSQLESGRHDMEFNLQVSADRCRIQQTLRKWTSPKRADLKTGTQMDFLRIKAPYSLCVL